MTEKIFEIYIEYQRTEKKFGSLQIYYKVKSNFKAQKREINKKKKKNWDITRIRKYLKKVFLITQT